MVKVNSSNPSSPRKTKPSTDRFPKTSAITKCNSAFATPIAAAFGLAGLAKGPNILKIVGVPNSFRAAAAFFIAGWKFGAKQNPIPIWLTDSATNFPSKLIATPKASNKSAEPHLLVAARFPCLTTTAPAAAATIAAVVEILMVFMPSPPVPTISTARCGM